MICPSCGNKLENDVDFCYFCGSELHGISDNSHVPSEESNEKYYEPIYTETPAEESLENEEVVSYAIGSGVGKAIKVLSVIVIILSVIGSLVIMGESFVTGMAVLLVSILTGLLAYGIGEIVSLLTSINHKL